MDTELMVCPTSVVWFDECPYCLYRDVGVKEGIEKRMLFIWLSI
jgi:hypothetical protein